MNKLEIAQAKALSRCTMLPASWDKRFVRAMAWQANYEPATPITPKQRYTLAALVYRYRRQLVGKDLPFQVPTEPPKEDDYQPKTRPPKQGKLEL